MSHDRQRGHHRGGGDNYDSGGGYNRGNRGGQPLYQRSYVGKKRDRDGDAPEDPTKVFISKLIRLGDPPAVGPKDGSAPAFDHAGLEEAVKLVKRDLMHKNHTAAQISELLLDCCTELSTKTHVYALLIGLLNAEDPELGLAILTALTSQLTATLASPQPADHDRARLLLRTLACLSTVNVAHPSAVVSLLEQLVNTALETAKSGQDLSGHTWQPWSDWLVYAAVAVLPWAGSELAAACPAEVSRLSDTVTEYLEARPIKLDNELRPFLRPMSEEDHAAKSDSGGASFLPWLWAGLLATSSESGPSAWRVDCLPSLVESVGVESRLAVGQPQDLPAVTVPTSPPQPPAAASAMDTEPSTAVRIAFVRQCYPPRGGISLLTEPASGKAAAERFVAEELIIDTLSSFNGERMACIKVLTTGLPIKKPYTVLLAEVIFGQLLALPRPRLPLMSYATVMVELCKYPKLEFPKSLSACIRECFLRLECMDPELPPRLIEFLSYHLSNFEYQWPWPRWEWCVDEPPSNPQRQFCHDLVSRLIRLSYYDRIHKLLPAKFKQLLGPAPVPPKLPGEGPAPVQGSVRAAGSKPSGQDGGTGAAAKPEPADEVKQEDAMEGVQGPVEAAADSAHMDVDGGEGAQGGADPQAAITTEEPPLIDKLAGEALTLVASKASCQSVLESLQLSNVEEALGMGPIGPLQVLLRAVLAAGSKSPSHLNAAMERYSSALSTLAAACPDTATAQQMILQQVADFYSVLPQKVLMCVHRLLALGLVSVPAVADWTTRVAIPRALAADDSVAQSSAWELLYYAVDRSLGKGAEQEEKRVKVLEDEKALRSKATELEAQSRATWSQLRSHMKDVLASSSAVQAGQGEGEAPQQQGPEVVETWSQEELVQEAEKDPRGRRLANSARDIANRADNLVFQADNLAQTAQVMSQAAEMEAAEPGQALLGAYQSLATLIAQEQSVQDGMEAAHGEGAAAEAQVDDPKAAAAQKLQRLLWELRALARRYSVQTASVLPQLQGSLGAGMPPPMQQALQEVLHAV